MPSGESRLAKLARSTKWLAPFAWQQVTRRPARNEFFHAIIAVADHFEPSILPATPWLYADPTTQRERVERWCREYPRAVDPWRDDDGHPLRHTYFYPAEQYDEELVARLADHCRSGWGEIEVHLHHGTAAPDSAENTRRALCEFRDALVRHGCLSRWEGRGDPRYAFVHGNFALANSCGGRACGVDEEIAILAETGCFADFTLPSAPNRSQIAKINALYECRPPLTRRAAHRRGSDLIRGVAPSRFPLIVEGPLGVNLSRRRRGLPAPCIENGALTGINPPTLRRFELWQRCRVGVRGRPDWRFIKLHCHGMDPRDESAMHGSLLRDFLRDLTSDVRRGGRFRLHFVTAREMVNIALAACDGHDGDPGQYRDYKLRLVSAAHRSFPVCTAANRAAAEPLPPC